MRRRDFIAGITGLSAALPLAARATGDDCHAALRSSVSIQTHGGRNRCARIFWFRADSTIYLNGLELYQTENLQ
jgi:hypothetical protein